MLAIQLAIDSMRRTTLLPLLLALAPSSALAQDDSARTEEAERQRISGLVGGASDVSKELLAQDLDAEIRATVRSMAQAGDLESLRSLGKAGAQQLGDLVRSVDLTTLIRDTKQNPLNSLVAIDPRSTLAVFEEELAARPPRFVAMALSTLSTQGGTTTLAATLGKCWRLDPARTSALLRAVMDSKAIDEPTKILLLGYAVTERVEDPATEAYLLERLDDWTLEVRTYETGRLFARRAADRAASLDPDLARSLAKTGPEAGLVLSTHPNASVRRSSLDGMTKYNSDATADDVRRTVLRLANDESGSVAALATVVLTNTWGTGANLEEIALVLESFQRHGCDSAGLAQKVANALERVMQSAKEEDMPRLTQALALVLSSRELHVQERVKFQIWRRAAPTAVRAGLAAYAEVGGLTPETARNILTDGISTAEGPERSELLLDCLIGAPEVFSLSWMDSWDRDGLAGLPLDRLSDAVHLLAHAPATDDEGYEYIRRTLYAWNQRGEETWQAMGDVMVRIAAGQALPGIRLEGSREEKDANAARARILAALARLAVPKPLDPNSRVVLDIALEALADPAQREFLDRVAGELGDGLEGMYTGGAPWSEAMIRICLNWPESSPAPRRLSLGVIPSVDELERLALDAARGLIQRKRGWAFVEHSRYGLANLMRRRPELIDRTILGAILSHNDVTTAAISIGVESQNPELRAFVYRTTLRTMRGYSGNVIPYAVQVLRFSEDEVLSELIDVAASSGDSNFVQWLDGKIGELMRLREAQSKLEEAGRRRPSLVDAVARTIELMDSEIPEVRVEAIRGLATLGAVEALPILIERVGTGTDEEKAAARESLAHLRKVAAQSVEGK